MKRSPVANQRGGLAMFIVVFMTILAAIPLGMQMLQISTRKTSQQLSDTVQANNVARAGLIEATSWFRRQPSQPVRSTSNPILYPYPDAAFYPRFNANPLLSDTIDESIGLVKEYALSDDGKLWGRFEVRRQKNPLLNPEDPQAVHDISDRRVEGALAGYGLAWYIEATGIVFRRKDSGVPYNVAPNEVVGRARAATEIRRVTILLPVNGALLVNSRDGVTLSNNARLSGESDVGLGYYTGTWGPTISGGSQITGTPNIVDIDGGLAGSLNKQVIFGVTKEELKLMSDYAVSSTAELPAEYPSMAIVYITGNATYDASHPLRGGGILFVDGNLTVESSANALFSGAIYVTGDFTFKGPALVAGTVVCEGNVTMDGNGDVAEVVYDVSILNSVRQQVAQYRENKAVYHSFSSTK